VSEPTSVEQVQSPPALIQGSGCRMVRLRKKTAGFLPGDLLMVAPGAEPEGGEWVIDLNGRLGRHGGGPVWGVVVGVVRRRPTAAAAGGEP